MQTIDAGGRLLDIWHLAFYGFDIKRNNEYL